MCAKLVIQYLMCSFRLLSSTCQNLISRGLPILGSFCKLLGNVVTETFAEPSENLGSLVKSNFDRWTIPFLYKCQISDSLFDVQFPTCQFYLLRCEVTRAPNFQKVLQTTEEFCNKNIPVMFTASTNNGGLQGDFDLRPLLLTRLTL